MSLLAERQRRQAEHVLERDYLAMREEVLRSVRSVLHRMSVPYQEDELQWFYNTAWWALYEKLRDGAVTEMEKHNPGGFLVTAATRRAIDAVRRAPVRGRVDVIDVDERGTEPDFADMLDNRHLLRQFSQGLREKLTERECQVATLCWIEGYTRPEAARILDLPEDRVQKIMDAATPKIFALVETIKSGGWCEEHRSMMRAFARDWLDPSGQRYKLARDHLDDCPACRRFVREALCVALPPVFIPPHGAGSGSVTWHALNREIHAVWRHHIHAIGPHVALGHSSAAAGAGASAGTAAGHAAGGGLAGGSTGLLAGPGAKLGTGLAALIVGGTIAAHTVLHSTSHHHKAPRPPTPTAAATATATAVHANKATALNPGRLIATPIGQPRTATLTGRRPSSVSPSHKPAQKHPHHHQKAAAIHHKATAEFTPETGSTATSPPPPSPPATSSPAASPPTHPAAKSSTQSSSGQCEFTFEAC